MNHKQELEQIETKHQILLQKAIEFMQQVTDPKHSLSHMEAIVNYTKEILEKIPEADPEVCLIAAYWHDVGRIVQEKGHAEISAEMLQTEMKNLNYNEELIEKCYLAIYKHSWKENPETLEGKIIRDADKIDFVGIGRWKECIETNCRFSKILKLLPTMRKELLKLDCSREIFDREIANLIVYLHNQVFGIEE